MPDIQVQVKGNATSFAEAVRQSQAEMKKLRETARQEGKGMFAAFSKGFEKLGGKELLLGAVGGGSLIGAFEGLKSIAEEYAKLYDISRKFDASPESMQRLGHMAKLAGTDLEGLSRGLLLFQRDLEKTDDPKVQQAMKELGLSARDLAGLSPEKQVELLADAFNNAQLQGRGVDATLELLGKSGGNFLALFRDYAEIKEKTSGISILSAEEVKVLKDGVDWLTKLNMQMKVFAAQVVTNPTGPQGGQLLRAVSRAIPGVAVIGAAMGLHEALKAPPKAGEAVEDKARSAEEIKVARARADLMRREQAAADQKAAEDAAKLKVETDKLQEALRSGMPDDERFAEDRSEIDAIMESMQKLNDVAGEEGLKAWAESLRDAGNTDGLKEAVAIIERINRLHKDMDSIAGKEGKNDAHFSAAGETAGALDTLFGRHSSALISDTERGDTTTHALLKDIHAAIREGKQIPGSHSSGAPSALPDYFHGR